MTYEWQAFFLPIEAKLSVLIDFRWKLLNLMSIKTIKETFENFINRSLLYFRKLWVNLSNQRTLFLTTATMTIIGSNFFF